MPTPCLRYIAFFKPFNTLSQFTDKARRLTIANFGRFPKTVYPVGRLDYDSEGLLLLTDDAELTYRLLEPRFGHPRTYWVQVEGIPTEDSLGRLHEGVIIQNKKTLPAKARLLPAAPSLPERSGPIRTRKTISTAWIELSLCEGRNRQVRKMTASVGYPTLRLVRVKIGNLEIGALKPGESRDLTPAEIHSLRHLVQLS
jgi:23S rRNA pseudouridine2457 synthase